LSAVAAVLRSEPRARWFLVANAQSAIGTGAATVGLVVLAYDRMRSPWAITLVLLADFLPSMVLGPIFGAMADRWSRRGCAIVADALRAGAFVAIGLVDSFAATIVFAVIGGIGTALFSPAVLAGLPTLAAPERRAAVTSLYGATRDVGRTLGPLLAAVAFPLIGAENLMVVNGATFLVSVVVLAFVPFGRATAHEGGYPSLLRDAREGLSTTWRMPGVRVVLWASTAVIVFAAMVNVGELLLARDLGAGAAGFAVLMTAFGVGVVSGSLAGARGGELPVLKSRYLLGIALVGVSVTALALTPNYAVALVSFFAMGLGNGIVVVHERLIFQAAVPDRLMGRAFALLETLGGWGFAAAFIGAAAIVSAIGTRGMFGIAGAGGVLVWAIAALSLRRVWTEPERA
jgi:MFS family permease